MEEVASKTQKHIAMRTNLTRFPFVKTLKAFDFGCQPELDKKQIQALSTFRFQVQVSMAFRGVTKTEPL